MFSKLQNRTSLK